MILHVTVRNFDERTDLCLRLIGQGFVLGRENDHLSFYRPSLGIIHVHA